MPAADPDLIARIEQEVDRHDARGTSPGLAYGLVADGRLVHAGGRGARRLDEAGPTPDADTVFRIASMTKSFTAATVLSLRDAGLLRLDDPVADHVPDAAGLRPPTDDAPPVTVRHLLTMAAGLPTDDPWGDRQQDLPEPDFRAMLRDGLGFAWTPGTAFEYSNTSYAVLGQVISAAAGIPYPKVVGERLLAPLGLASTGYTEDVAGPPPRRRLATGHRRRDGHWDVVPAMAYGAFAPMGGLFSTVTDLARWIAFLASAFPPRDGADAAVLSRASRRELQLPHLTRPPIVEWTSVAEPPTVTGLGYGLGLLVERDSRFGVIAAHSGGYPGYGSHMRWHPGTGLGVVVLANATYAPAAALAARLLRTALTAAADGSRAADPRRPGACPAPAPSAMLAATEAARHDATRLILAWDDQLADRVLAGNVDLDEPLPRRQRRIEHLVSDLGPLEEDPDAAVESTSPAHCAWWLRGPGGRLRVEILLTPERPPRVQSLTLTPAAAPTGPLRRLVDQVTDLLGQDDPRWPEGIRLADPLTAEHLTRQLRVAAAWAGACRPGPVLAGDGHRETALRLDGERSTLRLALGIEEGSRDRDDPTVTALALTPLD